jgi:uncharacterized membrane protein
MLALLLLIPAIIILWRWRGMRVKPVVLLLRLLMVGLIILSLADPTSGYETTESQTTVILVDQSDSLTADGKTHLRTMAANLSRALEVTTDADDQPQQVVTLWFGERTTVPGTWNQAAADEIPPPLNDALGPEISDIGQALQTARELVPGDGGRIILLSDGIQTGGDAVNQARQAAASGTTIDVWPADVLQEPEIHIAGIAIPRSLRVGEEYDVRIDVNRLNSSAATITNIENVGTTQAVLQLWESMPSDQGNERLLAEEQVELTTGINSFTFDNTASESGIVRLRARVFRVSSDTFSRNNEASATTIVAPQPRVLLVEGTEGNTQELSSALWRSGIESDSIPARRLPSRLSQLRDYDGLVMADVSAYNLSLDQMTTVREFVRSEGHGLLVLGGRNGYSLGGYEDTPLEEVLPVLLEPPPRPHRSNVALLLIMDRSASMSIPVDISKFDMAKEAAILSTEMLQSDDRIGILSFDTRQDWTIPFQNIGEGLTLKQIQDAIVMLSVGGGTDIYGALNMGLVELANQEASVRHAVLLTDGRSFTNDMEAYRQVVGTARDNDITLSTIAIGIDSDTVLLDELSRLGGGRYYYADQPEDIPRLTLQESEIARADPVVEGMFYTQLARPHPLLRGFSMADLPELQGYVATTRRDNAEVILESPGSDPTKSDPILASWQYGLGRVVAWTSSVADPWAGSWPSWGEYGPFWAQVIRYTLPRPDNGTIQIRFDPNEDGVRLIVEAFEAGGNPVNLANAAARITMPDSSYQDILLHQVAPGQYIRNLFLPTDGSYAVQVRLEENGREYWGEMGYTHNVPAEYTPQQSYRPPDAVSSDYLQGRVLLERIAQLTGGEVLDEAAVEQMASASGDADDTGTPAGAEERYAPTQQLWLWLLVAALVVWLLEVAVRRNQGSL